MNISNAQRSALIGDNIAVFYPPNYEASYHAPSLALVREPEENGKLPENWAVHVNFSKAVGKNIAFIPINEKTDLYGTGEVTGALKRNGTNVELWNTDNVVYASYHGRRLYQSHPWVLGVREDGTAFGVLADNTWRMEINLANGIWLTTDGPAFRVIVIERENPEMVVQALAELTGKMEMPPRWSLGFQQCRWSYYPDTRVKEIADTFRVKQLPCDVIWMDIHYMDKYKVFTFDPERFPNPDQLNGYLHDKGFKAVWMIDPGVKAEKGYSVYDSGTKNDVWVKDSTGHDYTGHVWPGECVFPDFTRPETNRWWANLYQDYMKTGIDGVWNDMNEPSVFDSPTKTMPENTIHSGGDSLPKGTHERYHNVYGMLMVKASREGIEKANPNKRPFVLTRSNYLGGQRYAATWTGDNAATWEHLKMSIPMSLNLGLSGQPFNGPDIGGFGGNASPELFGHWIALGAFYPFSRAHTMKGTHNQEPWAFGEEIEEVSRIALNRRYKLLPYFYTLFYESSINGMPVMRPAFFADFQNLRLRKEDEAFLLGKDLYIVPKWAEEPRIPDTNWYKVSIAGESLEDTYQPDVLIRPGAIVPVGKIIQNTTEYSLDTLTLMVSLDEKGTASGKLYHDAGDGYGYKKGEYALVSFSAVKKDGDIVVEISSKEGNMDFKPTLTNIHFITSGKVLEAEGDITRAISIKTASKN